QAGHRIALRHVRVSRSARGFRRRGRPRLPPSGLIAAGPAGRTDFFGATPGKFWAAAVSETGGPPRLCPHSGPRAETEGPHDPPLPLPDVDEPDRARAPAGRSVNQRAGPPVPGPPGGRPRPSRAPGPARTIDGPRRKIGPHEHAPPTNLPAPPARRG